LWAPAWEPGSSPTVILYSGTNCGAGEFGLLPYLEASFERYASGQFFLRSYGQPGKEFYRRAVAGDEQARRIFAEFGHHLGEAIKAINVRCGP